MNKILLTGFEPFDGENINPSWELVKSFNHQIIKNYEIITIQIPTVFYESKEVLKKAIKEYEPSIIISLGQAGGSNSIRLERIAVNLNDATIPDNKGNQPIDETIILDGPNAYFTKLPVRKLLNALNKEDIPTSLSLSAGAYVCNHLFYHLLNTIDSRRSIGGFIHIPYIDSQVTNKKNTFSLSLQTLQKALTIILETTINTLD
ncbi:pyroglutamyl-peptidase I [Mycoplasmatota bacterium]|nr:pyroglutamyl-peptidase I [Mycoplasmatota bacterium]